jgi:hypothetical protein
MGVNQNPERPISGEWARGAVYGSQAAFHGGPDRSRYLEGKDIQKGGR